jgi:hypothetical protein
VDQGIAFLDHYTGCHNSLPDKAIAAVFAEFARKAIFGISSTCGQARAELPEIPKDGLGENDILGQFLRSHFLSNDLGKPCTNYVYAYGRVHRPSHRSIRSFSFEACCRTSYQACLAFLFRRYERSLMHGKLKAGLEGLTNCAMQRAS